MSKYLGQFTGVQMDRILDSRLHSPIHDCVGDNYTLGVPLAMSADVEYTFQCNCNLRNFSIFPNHITTMWDGVSNVATFAEFDSTPEIVANIGFVFNPNASSEGLLTVKAYVNETVPILVKAVNTNYKASPEQLTLLLTFYAGDAVGFDVKNKGVFFTVSSSLAGEFYDPSIELYRT